MSQLNASQLKQRIVGIIMLVSLAVIFLPAILDGEAQDNKTLLSTVPPPPEAEPIPEIKDITPAPDLALSFNTPKESPANNEKPAHSSKIMQSAETPDKLADAESSTPTLNDNVPIEAPANASNRWYLKIGAFKSKANVDRLLHDAKPLRLSLTVRQDAEKSFYHVYYGPFADKAKAMQKKDEVDAYFKVKSGIVALEAD